jgi:hypothetical protein
MSYSITQVSSGFGKRTAVVKLVFSEGNGAARRSYATCIDHIGRLTNERWPCWKIWIPCIRTERKHAEKSCRPRSLGHNVDVDERSVQAGRQQHAVVTISLGPSLFVCEKISDVIGVEAQRRT